MKKISLFFFVCAWSFASAYTPSEALVSRAESTSKQINAYITSIKNTTKQMSIRKMFLTQLPTIQKQLMLRGEVEKMYIAEYIRRDLSWSKNIITDELIDDDDDGYTWTHAPNGFDIFYFQDQSCFGSLDMQSYTTLINGSYFSRMEGGIYPSWLLYFSWLVYTEFLTDDRQITHLYCQKNGTIEFWDNDQYVSEEDIKQKCDTAFQSGPLLYSLHDGVVSEDLAQKQYIGSANERTVMVVFESYTGKQDVWFLTAYKAKTLAQIRDIVLTETRFYGTYKNIDIFNLDGGSSVAYLSKKYPALNFGKSKQLPIVFGIK